MERVKEIDIAGKSGEDIEEKQFIDLLGSGVMKTIEWRCLCLCRVFRQKERSVTYRS